MNAGTSGSRVVVLTELRMLFEERAIPAPTANRIVPRARPRALAGAMNHLPPTTRASDLVGRSPLSGPLSRPTPGHAGGSLGSATAAPIWAWAGPERAARRAFTAPATGAGSTTRATAPHREPGEPGVGGSAAAPSVDAATPPPAGDAPRAVQIPGVVLRAMAAEAARTGRCESELWAEAARDWLDRQDHHDDPPPAAAALAPTPALRATRERCWSAIDILLSDLRAPDHAPDRAPVPAAAIHATVWESWDGRDGSAA